MKVIFARNHKLNHSLIRLGTMSMYGHCGVLFQREGEWVVLETTGHTGVVITPIKEFLARYTSWVVGELPVAVNWDTSNTLYDVVMKLAWFSGLIRDHCRRGV